MITERRLALRNKSYDLMSMIYDITKIEEIPKNS